MTCQRPIPPAASRRRVVGALVTVLLSACASAPQIPSGAPDVRNTALVTAPLRWDSVLATSVNTAPPASPLGWGVFGDPLLAELIDASLSSSGRIAGARAQLEASLASQAQADGFVWPSLSVIGSTQRQNGALMGPPVTSSSSSLGLQASWAMDIWGGQRDARSAAIEKVGQSIAEFHGVRLLVASDTARTYLTLRNCRLRLSETVALSESSGRLASYAERAWSAGLIAGPERSSAQARRAGGELQMESEALRCKVLTKDLVATTGIPEADLEAKLKARTEDSATTTPAAPPLPELPAQLLVHRPDLVAAKHAVWAAELDVLVSRAQERLQVSIGGFIGHNRLGLSMGGTSSAAWSIGPLQITWPIFDAGARAAQSQARVAASSAAKAAYVEKARRAFAEVEQLLETHSSLLRQVKQADGLVQSFQDAADLVSRRVAIGIASDRDLEAALQEAATSKITRIEIEQRRQQVLIDLHLALGGDQRLAIS